MKLSSLLAAPLLLAAIATPALAETAPAAAPVPAAAPMPPAVAYQQPPAPERNDSINVSPFGLFAGNLYLTYEHLFAGGHGVIVDAGFGRASNSDGSEAHGAFGVGYRWHWRGRQNSGFLGLSLHQEVGEGNVTYNGGTAREESYDMDVRSTTLTANVGKRWMIRDRFNVTLRLGLGLGSYTAEAKDDTPDAKMAEADMNALLALLPVGFEGELSVGYNF